MSSSILNSNFNCSVDSGFVDITGDPPSSTTFTDPMITPSSRLSSTERIKAAIKILRDGRISILDFMLKILDPSEASFAYNRDRIFNCSRQEKTSVDVGKAPVGKLEKMLDCLFADSRGRTRMMEWFRPRIISSVSAVISQEMDAVKENAVVSKAPVLNSILHRAAQTDRAKDKNKLKDCSTACNIIITQLASQRSHHSVFFAAPFTLFLWTNGASKQTIEALYHCGLCISFTSLLTLLKKLAARCLDCARQLACRPHIMCYDNINISTSIFVEQRPNAPAKVQSGTFAILYEARNANPEHMRLSPMLSRILNASELTFNTDVRPGVDQMQSFHSHLRAHIVDILLENCSCFKGYHRTATLQHGDRRKMPQGYRTQQFPLCTSTIDESSVTGNIAVIHDVYVNQLRMQHGEFSDRFTRLQFIQLGFGLFHLCLNLVWALLHVHRGSVHQIGSLSYFFTLLDCKRLGCEHPDYHTLLATLMQILRGTILNAWRVECGYPTLAAFASSQPTANQLLAIADEILSTHASPAHEPLKKKHNNTMDLFDVESEPTDVAQRNLQLLTRDLLYVLELTSAIPAGDWGRIEDILGNLAMMFRGAGSNNYCSEILHFLFNLKKIWTPEFVDIMRDNALVNLTGLDGHSKGIYSTWDRLGDISATVALLQNIKKQVGRALGTAYSGTTHTTPDTSSSTWKVANKINELSLQVFTPDREENDSVKPMVNILWEGERKLKSSTLTTFNKKVRVMLAGGGFEPEEDELSAASFDLTDIVAE
ncbi:hypothetical protein EDB19DRAFT_2043812 [Suillus lakei]|nr:hypothetical protein EDB19DRAFT_2043812 [Suillus lakei]